MRMAATAPPLLSFMFIMTLVVLAGTACFAAIHPRFFWRMLREETTESEQAAAVLRLIRRGGLGFGAASLVLIILVEELG